MRRNGRIGRVSRLGTALNVAVTVALAVAAVVLVNWLSARPGVRQRIDLTAAGQNTLSTASLGLLSRLEDDVRIELLYRDEQGPAMDLERSVMQRSAELVELFQSESNGRIEVGQVDTNDVEGWKETQRRLKLRGFENGFLVTSGERVAFLRLTGDLAQINPGTPSPAGYVPPTLAAFTAEAAIVEGILDVTQDSSLRAVFTSGAGEPGLDDVEGERELGQLADALRAEGFELDTWNSALDGPLPDDTALLVVVAPKGPWPGEMYQSIVDWVGRGGRIVVAPAFDPDDLRASDVPDLVDFLGLTVSEGRVCAAVLDPRTNVPLDGIEANEVHDVPPVPPYMASHPITAPFLETKQALRLAFMHEVGIRVQPPAGFAQRLLFTRGGAWVDEPPIDRTFDPQIERATRVPNTDAGPCILTVLRSTPMVDVPEPAGLEEEPEVRAVLFGSDAVLWNRSARFGAVVSPAFNWAVEREHRISVSPRNPDLRFMPRGDAEALGTVTRFAQLWMPGALVALGVLVWIVRARGSRRRVPAPLAAAPRPGTESAAAAPTDA